MKRNEMKWGGVSRGDVSVGLVAGISRVSK